MANKKIELGVEGLTDAEQAILTEQEEEPAEVDSEEEAQGDEDLSTDEPKAEKTEEPEKAEVEETVEKPEPTTVPLAALDSERHKRKEAEGRLAVLEDKMTTLMAPKPVEPPAPEEIPDPVVDIEGFRAWHARREAAAAVPLQQMTEQMLRQQRLGELGRFADASERAFTTENADYSKALAYARDLYSQDFRGWGHSEEKIPLMLHELEVQITSEAHVLGKDPAKVIYDWALRHGFKAEAPAKDESPGDKIARLAETQKTTKSTAGAGGTAREEEWTAERIADLSDKEMAALPDDVFERVMGG